jgi:Flp pilus assembly protein TadG
MRLVSRGLDRRGRGQSLTEFALVVPMLLLLLFGTIQVGITYGGYNGLINAVREAARFGSVCSGTFANCGPSTTGHLLGGIQSGVFGLKSGSRTTAVSYADYTDAAGLHNTQISVTACVRGIVFIPFVGNILGWSDPSGVPLKTTEVFRVEGQPTAAAAPGLPANYAGGDSPGFGGSCP